MNAEILDEISNETTPYTNFKFRLKNPDQSLDFTRMLETVFIENGMIAVSTEELIDRQRLKAMLSTFYFRIYGIRFICRHISFRSYFIQISS